MIKSFAIHFSCSRARVSIFIANLWFVIKNTHTQNEEYHSKKKNGAHLCANGVANWNEMKLFCQSALWTICVNYKTRGYTEKENSKLETTGKKFICTEPNRSFASWSSHKKHWIRYDESAECTVAALHFQITRNHWLDMMQKSKRLSE